SACIELPGLDSNQDKESQNPTTPLRNINADSNFCNTTTAGRSAGRSDQQGERGILDPDLAPYERQITLPQITLPEGGILDPDLAALVVAWPTLPDPIRAAIRALVGTVAPTLPPVAGPC